ncbi:MAG: glycoside hydrolase family 2 TIM barrel-domain containing protein [Bacteroidia bacterium]|nr:glycoside hydrolase family 2 TIM barrel-domain containing protein [Bacteroidia bacterium]
MYIRTLIFIAGMALAFGACQPERPAPRAAAPALTGKTVEILQTDSGYVLYRQGQPYFIKGATFGTTLDKVRAYGGNCVRTYTTIGADSLLDAAHREGMTVFLCLYLIPGRLGMDYSNEDWVRRQLDSLRQDVLRYKDHPALLMWGIGNELELHYPNPDVWKAINQVAQMIHETDPNHPAAAVVLAQETSLRGAASGCPDIDLLAVNSFSSMPRVSRQLRDGSVGWNGPYVYTEWGNRGAWEAEKTHWDVAIERTSSIKAEENRFQYEQFISSDPSHCLGSFVFYWGQKQERTHTWHSMFAENGMKTPMVDMMSYLWTGAWPANRAPQLDSLLINGQNAFNKVYLHQGQTYEARVFARDPEGDSLTYTWELLPEGDYRTITGGDKEPRPVPITGRFETGADNAVLTFRAPDTTGPYRIFVYVRDAQGESNANVPFFVTLGSHTR